LKLRTGIALAAYVSLNKKPVGPQIGLANGYNIGFFDILVVMLSNAQAGIEFPAVIKETLIFLLSVMAGELEKINSFRVGSSCGSKEKSDQAFSHVVKT
jgi:hypothetical protein